MNKYRVEAIILQTVRYGESDQIITAFSRENGVIKLIFKTSKGVSTISPLTRVELIYSKGRSDLYRGWDVVTLDGHRLLRENFELLQAGCEMLEAVRQSQGEREAPMLYALLCVYLSRLPELKDPGTAVVSFYLKVLKHEGLLSDDILSGLNEEEQLVVQLLAGCRRVADFAEIFLPPGFFKKAKQLFLTDIERH